MDSGIGLFNEFLNHYRAQFLLLIGIMGNLHHKNGKLSIFCNLASPPVVFRVEIFRQKIKPLFLQLWQPGFYNSV